MRLRAWAAAAVLAVLGAAGARAQTPDSTAAPVVEPAPDALPADSVEAGALPRPSVAPPGPAEGRPVTPVPALTAALSVQTLLADRPGAWAYALGEPGHVGGVSLDGLDPAAPALLLDDRPLDDLFTGAPRYDLLPAAAVGPLRIADTRLGRPLAVTAAVRPFRVGVPVTELRYGTGQEGVRQISGTHAQTRRPPALLRGGSDDSRLTLTGHVASRRAGDDAGGGLGGRLGGADVRHLDALGRLLLTRPGLAAEAGVLHTDRTAGARLGAVANEGAEPFGGLFNVATASVFDPDASRRTLRTEFWGRARLPLFSAEPLEAGASYVDQRLVYVPSSRDTVRVHGRRVAGHVRQRGRAGNHAVALRLDAIWDADPGGGADLLGDPGSRLALHAVASDSLRLGPVAVAAEAGLHRVGGEAFPSAALRAEAGPLFAGVRYGGRPRSRIDEAGLAAVAAGPDGPGERVFGGDVGAEGRLGDVRLALRAFGHVRTGARELAATSDTSFTFVALDEAVQEVGVAASVGWRERAPRGVYLRAEGTARALLDADRSDLTRRLGGALPGAWGAVRLGLRAEGVGDDVLDLDLAAVGHGWTRFRSRRVEPATGLLALPQPGAALGIEIPAQATLGLEATATFSARASIFLRYDNALAERATPGALVTQGEPLPGHVLRFGVFWALLY